MRQDRAEAKGTSMNNAVHSMEVGNVSDLFVKAVYLSIFPFKRIFIGVELLSNLALVSAVQQSESGIRTHIFHFLFFWISSPSRSPQSTD